MSEPKPLDPIIFEKVKGIVAEQLSVDGRGK